MKKFKFRLEVVEKVRTQKEKEALKGVSEAQEFLQKRIQDRKDLEQTLGESLKKREALAAEQVPKSVYAVVDDFIQGTKVRIQQAIYAIDRAEKSLRRAKEHYFQCRKSRMMITKLREKEYAAYKRMRKKKEEKDLDDLYVMRARLMKGVI